MTKTITPTRTVTVYAIHDVDADKLASVSAEMRSLGAPTIRVVDCGDYYQALEGSHRLAAAQALGLMPTLVVYGQDEPIEIAGYDWYEADNWAAQVYEAGEVAGELQSMGAVPYRFEG